MAPGVIKVLESFKKVVKVIKSSKSSKSSKGSKGSGKGWGPGPGRAQPGPPRLAQQSPGAPPRPAKGSGKGAFQRESVYSSILSSYYSVNASVPAPEGLQEGARRKPLFFVVSPSLDQRGPARGRMFFVVSPSLDQRGPAGGRMPLRKPVLLCLFLDTVVALRRLWAPAISCSGPLLNFSVAAPNFS